MAAGDASPEVVVPHDATAHGHEEIAILDFGSQYSHIIARRIRELDVYCEMHSCLVTLEELRGTSKGGKAKNIKGVVLSGGPFSVYEDGAPHVKEEVWKWCEEAGVPVLGVCYGYQEMMTRWGGKVEAAPAREFGRSELMRSSLFADDGAESGVDAALNLLAGVEDLGVWMSHSDKITAIPDGFQVIATTEHSEYAAVVDPKRRWFGIQFHAEVSHTPDGKKMLGNFVKSVCGCAGDWSMASFLEESIKDIQAAVGPTDHVIGAVSGGVDSTVAAALVSRAIGDRFHAVLVDNGVMRKDECSSVLRRLRDECGINLSLCDASAEFLAKLAGVEDPERKRKIIGETFVHVFEREAHRIETEVEAVAGARVAFLLQGTLYPDVIESVSFKGPSATIKSHHNVGGLLEDMKLKLVEPLRELFKDEVRALGLAMGLPASSIWRHPFPGPGLAVRILSPVDEESLRILRDADDVYMSELHRSGEYNKIAQAFAVLLPCRAVGVMGDYRTYERIVALRAVQTTDFMTAQHYPLPHDLLSRIATRIVNEVDGVNRVLFDITSKPPGTIEFL